MSSAELLAKLNPHGQRFTRAEDGTRMVLTGYDVAAALGMARIPDGAKHLARLKWAKQATSAKPVAVALLAWWLTQEHGKDERYLNRRSYKLGLLMALCQMSVTEYSIAPVCPRCQGTRINVTDEGQVQDCPRCHGFGIVPTNRQHLVRTMLPIPLRTFYTGWDDLYGELIQVLEGWEHLALSTIGKRLA